MENKILQPHSGTSESSRKRKLITVDTKCTISESDHVLDGGILKESNWQSQTRNVFIPAHGGHEKMSVMKSCDEPAGKAEFGGPGLQAGMNYRINKSFDFKQIGQTSNSPRVNVISDIGTGSLFSSSCVGHKEKDVSLQSELLFSSGSLGTGLTDNCIKEKGGSQGDGNMHMNKVEGSDVENSKHSFLEETVPRNGDCPPMQVDTRHYPSPGSFKSDEKSKSLVRKIVPTVAEKLWDGSLQLNSSVNVVAVAFFKSGEKMPNIKWSESVEVKGKVRLEAFEKYIQDLPRSRNRGLMVISLCWKEGSSETGLAGMKKVAKGYKEGERVGLAQLSPGIDLYVCPRSETIITILAKHGFFKGMAAVEDNQDSLIGCVVWRKKGANSVKKSEKENCSWTEQPVNFPPDSSTQRVAENNLHYTQPAVASLPVASGADCTTLEIIKCESSESKNIRPSNIQLELHNSSTIIKPLPTRSFQSNSLSVSVGLKTSCSDCDSRQDSLGQSLEVEAPQMHNLGPERPKQSLELQRPILSLPHDVVNRVASLPDDDDLPEFDFGASQGFRNMNGSLPRIVPTVESLFSNQRRLETSNLPMLTLDEKKILVKKFGEHGKTSEFPIVEEPNAAQFQAVTTPGSGSIAVPRSKNHFDEDDDDMPEWCPPDVEIHKQSVPQINRPSVTMINHEVPKSRFQTSSGPPSPLLPSPHPITAHPPFSTQTVPPAYSFHNAVTVRPVQPRPPNGYMHRGPISFMGSTSNPLSRPMSNALDLKFPIYPAGWRVRRS
ncbi:hypothetical protein I3760_03G239400 [Carya illinoinensis]|nr:hypothetical protein I3760_03G239400 [Carya illinoinensis]